MKRLWIKLIEKLRQLKGTPRSVALGAAFGISISFTPFVGFHSILACGLTWVLGGNVFAALSATLVGNPWTFPFIWISTYYLGITLLHKPEILSINANFYEVFKSSTHALLSFDFSQFDTDIWPIFYPMLIGCIPFCIAVWIISYYTIKNALQKFTINKDKF